MYITIDQYQALNSLHRWYHKYQHQVIEISGVEGTGIMDVVKTFISNYEFDPREVMWLSFDQKQVLEMAAKRYHVFYIYNRIYDYTREVDFDSLPVVNPNAKELKYKWKKKVRKKIGEDYKLIIVLDSILLDQSTLEDLCSFGLPILLIQDPMLIPSIDSHSFLRDPNVVLRELNHELLANPVTYFANKALRGESISYGNYDTVSVVPKKQLNLYNFKSAEMVLCISEDNAKSLNQLYRTKVMKYNPLFNYAGERLIVSEDLHSHKIVNPDEKNIKLYLAKGTVGYITKCNKHAAITRYIPIEFRMESYHEPFTDLYLDRQCLNGVETPSRQQTPDEIFKCEYAYVLSAAKARYSHWDKVTLICDKDPNVDDDIYKRMLYSAITRSHKALTIIV